MVEDNNRVDKLGDKVTTYRESQIRMESKIDTLVTIGWLKEFLIGDYGVLSLGLANAFLTILPILTVFFLAFNITPNTINNFTSLTYPFN